MNPSYPKKQSFYPENDDEVSYSDDNLSVKGDLSYENLNDEISSLSDLDENRKEQSSSAFETSFDVPLENTVKYDEEDVKLLLSIGYENELSRLTGVSALQEYKNRKIRSKRMVELSDNLYPNGYRGKAYVDRTNRDDMIKNIQNDLIRQIFRFVITLCMTILLYCTESSEILLSLSGGYSAQYPFMAPILQDILLLVVLLTSLRECKCGIRNYLKKSPSPYTISFVYSFLAFIYNILNLISILDSGSSHFFPIGCLSSCLFLALCGCDIYSAEMEKRNFRIFTSDQDKFVLTPLPTRKKRLMRNEKTVMIDDEAQRRNLYRIEKANTVTGYFRRTSKQLIEGNFYYACYLILLLVPILYAVFAVIFTPGVSFLSTIEDVLLASFQMTSFTIPCIYILCYPFSLAYTQQILLKKKCTLIGEETVEEFSEKIGVTLSDKDIFQSELVSCRTFVDPEATKSAKQVATILFRHFGGNIAKIVPGNVSKTDYVSFRDVSEAGLKAKVREDEIVIGSLDYLQESGISVSEHYHPQVLKPGENALYIAVNSVLSLQYVFFYTIPEKTKKSLQYLKKNGIDIAVLSFDPCLNQSFIAILLGKDDGILHVIKPAHLDGTGYCDLTDSGVITTGDRKNVIYSLMAIRRLNSYRKILSIWQCVFVGLGIILGAIFNILNPTDSVFFEMPLIFQVVGLTIAVVLCVTMITPQSIEFRIQEKNKNEIL